jgi:RimJ/RimL family protein N-acetyltransferase
MPTAPGPILETERLILRPTASEDFEPWADFMAGEETKYIGGPQARSAAWRGFMSMAGSWTLKGYAMFSVIEKSTGRWIGRLGPWTPDGWPGLEVGWSVIPAVWGKGYAVEGATAAIDWAFDHLGWPDVIHCIDEDNANSVRVAEKLGSTFLRRTNLPAPFEHMPCNVWGQTREQWRARKR